MARELHQPTEEAPRRPIRTVEELRGACGRSIGFVLALGSESAGDIHPAIEAAPGMHAPSARPR